MDQSDGWHKVHPEGFAKDILGVTIFFTIATLVILALRVYIRAATKANAAEDYLMYIGGVLNTAHNAIVMFACYTGLGTKQAKLNTAQSVEAAKMITLWQLFYVLASPFIKVSICANLVRIATQRRYVYPLYAASALSIAMTIMAFIIVFIQCIPFTASWTGNGTCISIKIIIIPTYVFSAVNIFVDWTVAILPAFILWDLQLRRKLKLLCYSILAVGVFSSVATIIRMPHVSDYAATHNKLYKLGNVIVWTVVELSLGILAGSLPSLRKLFKSLSADHSSGDHSYGTDLPTLRRGNKSRVTPNATYDCELNITVRADRDGSSDGAPEKDDDSTRHIIHVTRDVTQVSIQEAP